MHHPTDRMVHITAFVNGVLAGMGNSVMSQIIFKET